jgi:hypothetical protein
MPRTGNGSHLFKQPEQEMLADSAVDTHHVGGREVIDVQPSRLPNSPRRDQQARCQLLPARQTLWQKSRAARCRAKLTNLNAIGFDPPQTGLLFFDGAILLTTSHQSSFSSAVSRRDVWIWHETDLQQCPQFCRYRGKADMAVASADFRV